MSLLTGMPKCARVAAALGFVLVASVAYANHSPPEPKSFPISKFAAAQNAGSDDTNAVNAAVQSACAAGGGEVIFGNGVTSIEGTITISCDGVSLIGQGRRASFINCRNGAADCIVFSQTKRIYDTHIRHIYIRGLSKTGGNLINATGVVNLLIEDTIFDHCWNCALFYHTNTVTLRSVVFNDPHGSYAVKWDATPPERSDVLSFYDVLIQGGYHADGIVWDGSATTMRMFGIAIIRTLTALHVENSRGSKSGYPGYLMANDLEVDGASVHAVQIDGGSDFHFVNCDLSNTSGEAGQGNADGDAVLITPDNGHSFTRAIYIAGSRIANSRERAMAVSARDVFVTGTSFHDASKAGRGAFPVVQIGPDASDVNISGGIMGVRYGEGVRPSYGLIIDEGANRVLVSDVDFYGPVFGDVRNHSSGDVAIVGGLDNTGKPRTARSSR
jgi:hypothetical protein